MLSVADAVSVCVCVCVCVCLCVCSVYLFKLGRAPQIQDLYGKVKFTGESQEEEEDEVV